MEIAITLSVIVFAIFALIMTRSGADLVLFGGLTILLATGCVSADAAVHGFANKGLITVAALFIVAAGLEQTGAVSLLIQRILGHPKSALAAMSRLTIPTAAMSAVLNNTPVVAVMLPVLDDW